MTAIAWIGNSIRTHDNTALVRASQDHDKVLPLFIVDVEHSQEEPGCPTAKFRKDCLKEMRESLAEEGKTLCVRHGETVEELEKVVEEVDADAVYRNKHYTPYRRETRQDAREALDIPLNAFKDRVIFEEEEILTNSGTPYKVYSYYRNKWMKKEKRKPEEPESFDTPDAEPGRIPGPEELGVEAPDDIEVWNGGRENGLEGLNEFTEQKVGDYDDRRDLAAEYGTSALSPHLKFGTVSPREAFWASQRAQAKGQDEEGVETWQEELAWRDYYMQILHNYPHEVDEPFMDKYRGNEPDWDSKNETPEKWQAWVEGRTGYPFVDAGMRQLRKTGWMHNRLRMVTTNFSCKDLWLEWRDVHDYFNRMFVDAEIASMVGGIQWSYSIGTDAQPYFRVFNPITQGERYDEDGEYIRRWVPELEDVPNEHIHEPWKMSKDEQQACGVEIGEDYPRPIVDHDTMRKRSVERFEKAAPKS